MASDPSRRSTSQRRAIERVFASNKHPLTPAEVLAEGKVESPSLGIATVYRTLKQLVDEGRIVSVDLPGDAPRYEESGKSHHHHFHCKGCERVFDLEGCVGALKRLLPPGFSLDSHEVVLYGRCAACAT